MTKIAFTKLERSGDELPLGAVSVVDGAAVADANVRSLYDWSQVTDEASLRAAFDYISRHVAGRYLYAYWHEEADKAYNPDQPRHPAGDPRGGQWAAEEGGGAGVYDISPDARFALAQAINAVQDHGLATGNERLIVLDAEGKVLSDTKGDYESVSDLGAVDSPDAFVTVHNHPRSASFSEADIRLFLSTAMSHMVVIGHDGTIYTASKRPNTKKISRWENGDMPEDQRYVFNEWNTIKMKEFPRYQVLVTTGKMSGDSAWKEHTHEIGTELAMVLGYDYKRYL